ncbi:ribosomal protein L16 [Schizophyllum commune H4-8]|uniref:ribosomal protein L16 n=1 Tax=Schizophyllum commune (strain H4-8 / FGSC 9210) TaxID=578458 RepID=UPI00215F0544|nr:ribosomal protein L16 [Schizophyllum commune H4-8]KAI5888784.1 ribosomal protein L16 [Schizophyllum commune H4-8]
MLGLLRSALRPALRAPAPTVSTSTTFARGRHQLAPKQVKWDRKHKGRIPIPTGGSTRGTTLAFGDWGIRIIGCGARLTAKQLGTAEEVIKRKLKILKGSKVWMRVFPDIPVCVKVRGGCSRGGVRVLTYMTGVPVGRVIFEIGGVPIREDLAREILRQASSKLPCRMEFINKRSPPRLGGMVIAPPKPSPEEQKEQQAVDASLFAMESTGDAAPQPTA